MGLMLDFSQVPDRRGGQGLQYPLHCVLTLLVLGLLSNASSLRSIARWMRHHRASLNQLLGIRWAQMPTEGGLRQILRQVPAADLERALRGQVGQGAGMIHIDGKALRGRSREYPALSHLCSAFSDTQELVLAQVLYGSGNEAKAARDLLESLDIDQTWVSFDALHTQKKQ